MTIAINSAPLYVDHPTTKKPKASKCVTTEKDYWNTFYSNFSISHPSQFCVMTAIEVDRTQPIVEFGCGNGRDSIYLATHGHAVYGCDLSKEAIESNAARYKDVAHLSFEIVDASSSDEVRAVLDKAREDTSAANVTVYTRFFLHSIDQRQETKFLTALSAALIPGDRLYFEFRCKMDESLDKVHGKDHYRRYIDTPLMLEDLIKLDFKIEYEITGTGMAKYKSEDPFVSRIIARKV